MESKAYQFKTNINCEACVAKVTPFLDDAKGVCHWEVDTTNRDKVLTVKSEGITEDQVMETVKKAGFKIAMTLQCHAALICSNPKTTIGFQASL